MPPLRGSKRDGLRWLQRCRASGASVVGAGLGTGWNLSLPRGRKITCGGIDKGCTYPQMRLEERTRPGYSQRRHAAAPATSKPRQGRHLCSNRPKQFFSSVRSGIVPPIHPQGPDPGSHRGFVKRTSFDLGLLPPSLLAKLPRGSRCPQSFPRRNNISLFTPPGGL
jgi:hypothetical protein